MADSRYCPCAGAYCKPGREDECCNVESYGLRHAGLRWACPNCGRFVAESDIVSTDRVDPTAYYGVTPWTAVECSRCGWVEGEPRLVDVGAVA